MTVSFFVSGKSEPQGSTKGFAVGGRVVITSANRSLSGWRALVASEAQRHAKLHEGPVRLTLTFYMPRPKSRKKDVWCVTRPDADKLTRAICDSLSKVMYRDDSQVCDLRVLKLYESPDSPPGVLVEVDAP